MCRSQPNRAAQAPDAVATWRHVHLGCKRIMLLTPILPAWSSSSAGGGQYRRERSFLVLYFELVSRPGADNAPVLITLIQEGV
jgi:hypothetical protein